MAKQETSARKSRRYLKHGYGGYGSALGRGSEGGSIHWGRGFAGVGAPGLYSRDALVHFGLVAPEIWEPGPHRGIGPKGYSRSDDRIREDICDELTLHPDVDPSRVTVDVRDGEVTLEGAVEAVWTRQLVDGIASECVGVRQVHNRLRIEPAATKKARDLGRVS
ncbi:MAG TPA: BON domain-containing protein [Thermoanaerobaculia bacterium]|nr:BON domain-containing protein [Thermoanaerobaculia bacterium]